MSQPVRNTPVLRFESLNSTNEEALRQLAAGARPPLWIVADEQTRGRGRGGRRWHSAKGNFYATLLVETKVSPAVATQLSFVAGLAAYDAIATYLRSGQASHLRLKWPNDVMLDGAKVAGLLLESTASPMGKGLAVILGIGINISFAPPVADRPAATLGLDPAAVPELFASLAATLETWLQWWDEGRGFPTVREAWLSRALALNEPISVHLAGDLVRGKFCGVDAAGALQLETEPGVVITVTAGDIYPDALV